MNWYRNLYVGETYSGERQSVVSRVEAHEQVPGLLLIVLRTDDERNQLEILSQRQLDKSLPDEKDFRIIGIAFGRREADRLVLALTEDVYRATGTADLRAFLTAEQ